MRKLIISMHTSLDGFTAGPNGEMDWIRFDDALFDFVGEFTDRSDTALYGRVTYDMMDAYWPTAGSQPNASKHAKQHSAWYNKVTKVVASKTLLSDPSKKLEVIGTELKGNIENLKNGTGGDILVFGSPSIVRQLEEYKLIDEYWLMMNPIILGTGISMYSKDIQKMELEPGETKRFSCGVTALQFKKK
ncbi:dihydrofolate reductase family protein [Pseudoflavitalea rhizosphaerae]|uniref:dihydrofolate reductase family protein n=1 Tax=Pseudoflavitalea rhizosphaerae TaxID=1884793 RepID=UPI000F8C77FD|nr:dihydrofolate reductase family protein [Pseudoflavitalea rhizosphaerae]